MSFMSNSSGPYDVLIKVMMLGHSSVGKSSMVSSLCEQPFSPSHLHTIGIDFRVKHYHLKGNDIDSNIAICVTISRKVVSVSRKIGPKFTIFKIK